MKKRFPIFLLLISLTSVLACDAPIESKTEVGGEKTKSDIQKNVKEAPAKKEEPIAHPTSAPKKRAALPPMMKDGDTLRFGGAFTIKTKPITLAAALKVGPKPEAQKISGHIEKVCKAKGCWFILKSKDGKEVRVRMKDYGFFVPRNADGGNAIVEGILSKRILPKKEAQHYAEDAVKAGEKPEVITEDQEIFELMVSAVEITKPS